MVLFAGRCLRPEPEITIVVVVTRARGADTPSSVSRPTRAIWLRRLGGAAAAGCRPFLFREFFVRKFRFGAMMELGRSGRSMMRRRRTSAAPTSSVLFRSGWYRSRARARRSRATRSASRPTRSSLLGGASPISFSRVLFREFFLEIFPATLVSGATRNPHRAVQLPGDRKQAALKDQRFEPPVDLCRANSSRARTRRSDPRSERPAGAACWPPSPISFSFNSGWRRTLMMLVLLLRPPAAPRGSATG